MLAAPVSFEGRLEQYVTKQRVEAGCKITVITTNPEGAVYGS